jgi:hypothetical protein
LEIRREHMRAFCLIVILSLLAVIGSVVPASSICLSPAYVGTDPAWPTSGSSATIKCWAFFGDPGQELVRTTCTQTGNTFAIKVYMRDLHAPGTAWVCIVVDDGGSASVGPLAPGHYTVNAEMYYEADRGFPDPADELFASGSGAFDVLPTGSSSTKAVTDFTRFSGDHKVILSWQNPTDPGFTSTMIRYDYNDFPSSTTDGQLLCDRPAAPGSYDTYTHTVGGGAYYYSAFSYTPNACAGVQPTVTPVYACTIPEAKGLQDGQVRALHGGVVSAVFADGFYVQDPDYPWAIKVTGASATVGQKLEVIGAMRGKNGERCLECAQPITIMDPGPVALPLTSVPTRALGGADLNALSPGVAGGRGANNLGMLVCTWGKVTQRDRSLQYFYIDDGSGLLDGTQTEIAMGESEPSVGVRVKADPTGYAKGSYVAVTGISSCFTDGGVLKPQTLARPGGIRLLRP